MASSTREVVTLQIGHYANFVGTHWWNIQDSSFVYSESEMIYPKEINHDVLFREGRNLKGEVTYTPRLIAFDLKGSLQTLRQEGELYDIEMEEDNIKWTGDTTLHKVDTGQKNEFLQDLDKEQSEDIAVVEKSSKEIDTAHTLEAATSNVPSDLAPLGGDASGAVKLYDLDKSVDVWTDYLRPHLHPRTIHIVQQYHHDNELEQFDVFGFGQDVFRHDRTHSEMEDRLHFFLEECDNLQGMHILVDTYDAFGGLASAMLEELADDYVNKGILVFGVSPSSFKNNTVKHASERLLNSLLTYSGLTKHCSGFVPLTIGQHGCTPPVTFPHLHCQNELSYHSSAVLASSLDCVTLPHRMDGQHCLLSQMTQALTPANRKVLTLQSSLPFPMTDTDLFVDTLMACGDQLPWQPLTPICVSGSELLVQSVVVRGVPPDRLKSVRSGGGHPSQQGVLDGYKTTQEVLDQFLQDLCPNTLSATFAVRAPCSVTAPFPHIFSSQISKDGFLVSRLRPSTLGVETVPMMTSLQSNKAVRQLLDQMCTDVMKLDVKKVFHRFLEAGLEVDELGETTESLRTLAEYYDSADDMS
ncbi:Misato-like protein 1 [Lamellibrachia satsuma]|nr:Misato-like protein 1 [Lamellibrachia satsuma]